MPAPTFSAETLTQFARDPPVAAGLSSDEASPVARSLVVEILTGALSGGACAREVPVNQLGKRRTLQRNLAEGISFDQRNWSQLVDLARELGVHVPE